MACKSIQRLFEGWCFQEAYVSSPTNAARYVLFIVSILNYVCPDYVWGPRKMISQLARSISSSVKKFIAQRAWVLEKMVVVVASQRFSPGYDLNVKLKPLTSAKQKSSTN